ncbi:MAG: Smr/MutS family protein [Gammaproteobacteria bacterium]|nr:Smr/MutS family protein [Gammaproteobacteria bacterium]
MVKKTDISEEEQDLFRAEMDGVRPLQTDTTTPESSRPPPRPLQKLKDKQQVDELLDSPEMTTLEAGEALWFARPGLQHSVQRKLRRGQYSIEAELDLHGMKVVEARQVMSDFLKHCRAQKMHCVRVIHGKGNSSADKRPVLKNKVNQWLRHHEEILAFSSARPADGGTGAIYVLLRRKENN